MSTDEGGKAVLRRPETLAALNLTVLGGGLMGHSMAGIFARYGARVSVFEPVPEVRDTIRKRLAEQLERQDLPTRVSDELTIRD